MIVVSIVCLTTVFATQYARADIGYSYDLVHPSDSDIRYIASDNSSDGHRVLRANAGNETLKLEFGNWSANTNKTYSAAFGIVNEEAFCVKISDIAVTTTLGADYMQIWLHSNEDIKATSEAAGDAVFMWDMGVDPNDNFWVLGAGNQDSSDADFGSTPWDSDDGVRYATGTSGASNGSDDFVWVQISIVIPGNPDSLSEHTGTITIDFEETTVSSWKESPSNPVYDPTARAYYPSVLYDDNQFSGHGGSCYYKMWYGTRVGGVYGIGYAYSDDGETWAEHNNSQPLAGLYTGANHPLVEYDSNGFGEGVYYKMWYWSGNMNYTIYNIRYAESSNGIDWTDDQALTQDSTYKLVTGISGFDWNAGSYGPGDLIYNPNGSGTLNGGGGTSPPTADVYVDDDQVPGWYDAIHVATIAEGINNVSADGEIYIYDGTYSEQVTVNKAVTITGESGVYPKVNPNMGSGTVFTVSSADVTITGINISNGGSAGGNGIWDGIWVPGSYNNLMVDDCIFNNLAKGIRYYSNNLVVTNSTFYNIEDDGVYPSGPASGQGGSDTPLKFTIKHNFFHSPVAGNNTAVHIKYQNRYGEVSYNYITGYRNGIWYEDGGINAGYGNITICHNTMDNFFTPGSGQRNMTCSISLYATSSNYDDIIIRDNIFKGAKWYSIYQEGGAITGGPAVVKNNLFYDNYWYYWANYQCTYQWNGTGVSNGVTYDVNDTPTIAGWSDGPADGFNFVNNLVSQDPLFAYQGTCPETYFALQDGSPAVDAASDGTNMGAWQDVDIWNYKYVMYYMGTNGNNEYIGLAYSADGKFWKRYGDEPVLRPVTDNNDPGAGWDYVSVGYPTIIKGNNGDYKMWFCGGPGTNHGIGYATSADGINWMKDGSNPIFHKNDGVAWRNDRTYTPMVIYNAGKFGGHGESVYYKMWFSGKSSPSGNYAVGYAALK